MKRIILIALSIMLFPTVSVAESEDWYFNASIGLANKQNPDSVEQTISSAENTYGVSRVTISIDFGFYWPVFDELMLLGVVSNSSVDSVQINAGNEVITHDLEYLGISAIKFWGDTIGQGLFVRGDLGSATAKYRYSNNSYVVNDGSGSAALIGVGYSMPLSGNKTRLIFSLNTVFSSIEDREFNSSEFMIGFMW